MRRFTTQDLQRWLKAGTIRGWEDKKLAYTKHTAGKQKGSKYHNKRVFFDNRWFDSQKECNRYIQLRYLLGSGDIEDLRLQVPYELNPGGTHSLKYKADFVYRDRRTGEEVVEDVKGCRTAVYKKKKRLMKEVYGIEVKEV